MRKEESMNREEIRERGMITQQNKKGGRSEEGHVWRAQGQGGMG